MKLRFPKFKFRLPSWTTSGKKLRAAEFRIEGLEIELDEARKAYRELKREAEMSKVLLSQLQTQRSHINHTLQNTIQVLESLLPKPTTNTTA